ncbi:hypothetical protein EV421DRAFT_1903746 [Armillaria borealis]|uniref:Uncharacterized protein n=1 Tax=Armillaria borealis TaxID=47425 RepID=A0AA39JJB7_9AGAR|nr:hypothetical protein EV421DRAFT_1903746 [Armillaria borealis]
MPTNVVVATSIKQRLKMKLKRWKGKLRGYLERPGLVCRAETHGAVFPSAVAMLLMSFSASPPESQLIVTPINSTENVNVVVVNAGSHDLD